MNHGSKAVLKPPQSRRSARFEAVVEVAKRLDCGAFTAAFFGAHSHGTENKNKTTEL